MDLSGFEVVLAGRSDADEPGSPWGVGRYVDERAGPAQRAAPADIFQGRAGGTTLTCFAHAFGEVCAVRAAHIGLDHTPGRQRIHVDDPPLQWEVLGRCGSATDFAYSSDGDR